MVEAVMGLLMMLAWLVFMIVFLYLTVFTAHDRGNIATMLEDDDRHVTYDEKMERWEGIGDRLGLESVGNYPREHLRLEGDVHGEPLTIRRTPGPGGGGRGTVFEVSVEDLVPEAFSMSPRSAPDIVDSLVDAEDVLLGNERLDAAFCFQGMQEREVKEFAWRDGVEEHLLAVADWPANARIEEGMLRTVLVGEVPEVDRGEEWGERLATWVARLRELVEGDADAESGGDRPENWVAPE